MDNVIKIDGIEIYHCSECPYHNCPGGHATYYCAHDLKNPGLDVGDGEKIPDFCPFVLERLEKVLEQTDTAISKINPARMLKQIEKRQEDDPNPKFAADHGTKHVERVCSYGGKFLSDLISHGRNTENSIQKQQLLLQIAAKMHDIGLADSPRNHAIHSSELAKRFLQSPKIDIGAQEAYDIAHAIYNHSDGRETTNLLDAALLLGDKLDVAKERIIRTPTPITIELLKVEKVEYVLTGDFKHLNGAELHYTTSGENFKIGALAEWPKCVSVPRAIAMDFLKIPFKFIVDDVEIDMRKYGV